MFVDLDTVCAKVKFNERGLVPAIVQDAENDQVLMMAWMNAQSLKLTLETRICHYWSRSRNQLWKKGETSGNTLRLVSITEDCDRDTLLVRAIPRGPTCHTGSRTCFYRDLETE